MNDILPKPFTQDGLLDMLEVSLKLWVMLDDDLIQCLKKHLMHLKVMQRMAQIPLSVGIPPLSDSRFEEALAVGASSSPPMAAGRRNPLASMGLTDEQYLMILQRLIGEESLDIYPACAPATAPAQAIDGTIKGARQLFHNVLAQKIPKMPPLVSRRTW